MISFTNNVSRSIHHGIGVGCSRLSQQMTNQQRQRAVIFYAMIRQNNNKNTAPSSSRYHSTFVSNTLAEDDRIVTAPACESHMVLILGKPGGGKGTISGKILKDFPRFHHISTGDLLRENVLNMTDLGIEAKEYMDHGKLVPDELMIKLVQKESEYYINNNEQIGHSLLLDGFPRTIEQAKALDMVTDIDLVINLDIPTEIIVERIADRWIHPSSGRVYSYSYRPPKKDGYDDITGEKLIQRNDDKPESVRTRLHAYEQITEPLVQYYNDKGVLKTFHGTMSDRIYPEVKKWLQEHGCC